MTSRRAFLKSIGQFAVMASMPFGAVRASNVRINIVGGGVAGTRMAAYLKMSLPSATVMLFDPALTHDSDNAYSAIQYQYRPVSRMILSELGVETITEQVVQLDPEEKSVSLAYAKKYKADYLVVAPGVEFVWNDIQGYESDMDNLRNQAWHPGNESAIWQQIASMRNGDTVVISVPAMPYRFPQGPYQRASKIADYLQTNKPASKVLILDNNDEFPNRQAYLQQWDNKFPDNRIEWVSASNGGQLESVDLQNNTVYVSGGKIQAGVLNIIPAQRAGQIARQAGLAVNSDWCQVDAGTLESVHYKQVYVVGDANDADLLNKTAVAADEQAARCAMGIKAVVV